MKYYFIETHIHTQAKNRAETAAIHMINLFNHFVIAESDLAHIVDCWTSGIAEINGRNKRCTPVKGHLEYMYLSGDPVFFFAWWSVSFIAVVVDPPSELNLQPLSHPELASTQLSLF
jgi:hypothetical protein